MGKEIEKAWAAACKVMLGREIGKLDNYEKWLMENVQPIITHKSAISDLLVSAPSFVYYEQTQEQFLGLEEYPEWGKRHLEQREAASLTLENAARTLGNIRLYSPEVKDGDNVGIEECGSLFYNSSYCYKSSAMNRSKYCAFCMWPRQSEHIFGSSWTFSCQFCIKCFHSENLTRCFEVSNSAACADCYFCHNCENCHDSMFCFNAKNLRYAIGNREFPKGEYLEAKKLILEEMASKLEKNKALEYGIYDIGCYAGKGRKK